MPEPGELVAEVRPLVNGRSQWRLSRWVEVGRPPEAGPSIEGPFLDTEVIAEGTAYGWGAAIMELATARRHYEGGQPAGAWMSVADEVITYMQTGTFRADIEGT